MSKIEDITIRRILDAADIVDVVSQFVTLKKTGVRYMGLCPFHEDRHMGSFIVYPKGNCYKCFACEAKGDAVKFLMEHEHMSFIDAIRWLGQHYGIPVDDVPLNYTPPVRKEPEPLPMLEVPFEYVVERIRYEHDNLVDWIWSLPWDGAQYGRIGNTLAAYCIGHSKKGHTIFWQIDEKQRVRTGKMMKYYPVDHPKAGHRDKESEYGFDWIHSALFRSQKFPEFDDEKMEVKQCLFGQHLMKAWPNATINIVESEKTAVLMAIAYGNNAAQIWMACGGLYNITREKLKPLMDDGRRIQLFPDRDGIKKWIEKAVQLNYDKLGFNTEAVKDWWVPEDGEKADIADVVLRMIKENK